MHMNDLTLPVMTGIPPIDATLLAIVRAFEHAFPNRIRAYYLIGSYVEGTAVPLSDIDCFVIFADQFATQQEEASAEKIGEQCAAVSAVRLDIGAYPEHALAELDPVIRTALKLGSAHLYGVDIRPTMILPPTTEYLAGVVAGAQHFIARLRGEAALTSREVKYPDAMDVFFGYTRKSIPAWYPPTIAAGTKELVATMSRIATARVVWRTQHYVSGKQQAIHLFQQVVGGRWAGFVAQIFERCKHDWQYLVPEPEHERLELRGLCQQMLAFENEFLHLCEAPDER
jgi:hypothetical protein